MNVKAREIKCMKKNINNTKTLLFQAFFISSFFHNYNLFRPLLIDIHTVFIQKISKDANQTVRDHCRNYA